MTQGQEHQIAETHGQFTIAVKDGEERTDFSWSEGRIVLSNKRIVLFSDDGNRTISLSALTGISGAADDNHSIGALAEYLNLWIGEDMLVVVADDHTAFRTSLYNTLLGEKMLRAKHPAVEGGVITSESWVQARLSVNTNSLTVTLQNGVRVPIRLEEISTVQTEQRTVAGTERPIIAVSHAADDRGIETHLTGPPTTQLFTRSFLKHGERRNETDVELTTGEKEVLMALYSGISPFQIPDFVGREIEEVEAIYERLIELEILNRVRVRNEVALTASGRNIATQATSDR